MTWSSGIPRLPGAEASDRKAQFFRLNGPLLVDAGNQERLWAAEATKHGGVKLPRRNLVEHLARVGNMHSWYTRGHDGPPPGRVRRPRRRPRRVHQRGRRLP